jgi:outer membrane protein assembly factor BamA
MLQKRCPDFSHHEFPVCYSCRVMPHKLSSAFAAAIFSTAFVAQAQQFIPKSIQFHGDPEYSNEEMLAASGLKKGAALNYPQMNAVSKVLMDTGMFASLTFKFDGQDLIFQLTPADQFLSIHFDNLPLTPGPELDAKLHQQFPLYHGKIPSEGATQEQVRVALEKMLAEQGLKATVIASPGADPKTHHVNSVHFSIASPPVLVDIKRIEGASPEFLDKLNAIAKQAAKNPFDTDSSAAGIESVFTVFYQDRGYAAVKVDAARAGEIASDADSITVPFAVKITEGHIYKLGTIHLPEGAPVTQAEITKALAPTPNGPVDGVRVRSLWGLIVGRYHAKGYLDCRLAPTPKFDESTTTVNYDVAIEPGPVYHLGFVKFDNVSDELRTYLIRNWQMLPGDPFNETYVANFIASVQQNDPVLRRSLAGIKTTFDAVADPQTHDVNVVIRLAKQ